MARTGPRYAPARRLHEVRALLDSAEGTSIYDVAERFDVSVRTALRYVQALQAAGEPLYEETVGRRKVWRLMPTARRQTITLTTSQMVRLPWDYRRVYGLDPDEQPVADAVRASMSIPFFFNPALDSTMPSVGLPDELSAAAPGVTTRCRATTHQRVSDQLTGQNGGGCRPVCSCPATPKRPAATTGQTAQPSGATK